MKVLIPSPLRSYTKASEVGATGVTVAELFADLERQFPGIRSRIVDERGHLRTHVRVFVNGEQVFDLSKPLDPTDAVHIVQALSGG
ncbi:MAG: MoaD/ThiS family protein [Kofleriaceae bacterium]